MSTSEHNYLATCRLLVVILDSEKISKVPLTSGGRGRQKTSPVVDFLNQN